MTTVGQTSEREVLRRAALRAIGRFHRRWRTTDLADPVLAPLAIGFEWDLLGRELRLIAERLSDLARTP